MKKLKIGLNGFGRIGRALTRIALTRNSFDIVLINTRKTPNDMLAYLLQYDSVYRTFNKKVQVESDGISIDGIKIITNLAKSPEEIPWEKYNVDIVVDATGAFTQKTDLEKHLKGSVKKVLLTAPSKDDVIPHVVLGVNDDKIDWKNETVISNASCTTNCASPLLKILDDNFKIVSAFLTTTHAVTQTQSLLDDSGKSVERSRAAFQNIIPSTSGAAKAVVKILPQLKGKIEVGAIRVPVPTVSLTDISAVVKKSTTVEEVKAAFKKASVNEMKGILGYEIEMLVSSDYIGSSYSAIYDANYTKVIGGTAVKVFGWYDNEWGYSTRLADLIEKLGVFF
ncbi:MAG: type I glyceraldehyde-3-phosphate dehydrogenase [bacterium]|nr:type I glyceraldehyde-3-phosphate dehydrogenase [bacterium]